VSADVPEVPKAAGEIGKLVRDLMLARKVADKV